MKRVQVDFSTTVKGGLIRASQRRASETLNEGDPVEAFDPDEEMSFVGVVDHVDPDGRFAYLRMEWESVPYNKPGQNFFVSLAANTITDIVGPETSSEKGEGGFASAPQAGPLRLSMPA